jgi:serine O-acetyltransferase
VIQSKIDYKYYLDADREALGIPASGPGRFAHYLFNYNWRFQRLLRKVEYYQNCKRSPLSRIYGLVLSLMLYRSGAGLGFTIYPNVFGPGLSIAHTGTLIVSKGARVGAGCRIHNCVTIGTEAGHSLRAPRIGNNVYIGPGARIFGDIEIADGIAVGANSVVNRSFLEPGITIAGIPARKVSDKGSGSLLVACGPLKK